MSTVDEHWRPGAVRRPPAAAHPGRRRRRGDRGRRPRPPVGPRRRVGSARSSSGSRRRTRRVVERALRRRRRPGSGRPARRVEPVGGDPRRSARRPPARAAARRLRRAAPAGRRRRGGRLDVRHRGRRREPLAVGPPARPLRRVGRGGGPHAGGRADPSGGPPAWCSRRSRRPRSSGPTWSSPARGRSTTTIGGRPSRSPCGTASTHEVLDGYLVQVRNLDEGRTLTTALSEADPQLLSLTEAAPVGHRRHRPGRADRVPEPGGQGAPRSRAAVVRRRRLAVAGPHGAPRRAAEALPRRPPRRDPLGGDGRVRRRATRAGSACGWSRSSTRRATAPRA